MRFHGLTPSLEATDLPATLRFYEQALGLRLVTFHPGPSEGTMTWAAVRRDDVVLMLTQSRDPGRLGGLRADVALHLAVEDLEAARQELLTKGVEVSPINVTFYGTREASVRDPDGRAVILAEEFGEAPETVHDA